MKKWKNPELNVTLIKNTKWGNYPIGDGKPNFYDNALKTLNSSARPKTTTLEPPTEDKLSAED